MPLKWPVLRWKYARLSSENGEQGVLSEWTFAAALAALLFFVSSEIYTKESQEGIWEWYTPSAFLQY